MKYVVFFALLATLGGFVYWRLRPYIRMVRRFLGAVRDMRRVSESGRPGVGEGGHSERPRRESVRASGEPLVRCASCGTWLPASRAVKLPASKNLYCSHACLERAADATRSTRKTAS